jgi:hypothetical protein
MFHFKEKSLRLCGQTAEYNKNLRRDGPRAEISTYDLLNMKPRW